MNDIFDELEEFYKERYKGWEGAQQFDGTGNRLRKQVEELCWPIHIINQHLDDCFSAVFDDSYKEMLVVGPTSVWTLCPHHLVPCNFKVFIGYIPSGKVLGLSKFSRIAILVGKKPIMQEMYTRELADLLQERLNPGGVGVLVRGTHLCVEARGVQQDVEVVTSCLKGYFLDDSSTKSEFLDSIGGIKKY